MLKDNTNARKMTYPEKTPEVILSTFKQQQILPLHRLTFWCLIYIYIYIMMHIYIYICIYIYMMQSNI